MNRVAPFDWTRFLRRWLDAHEELDAVEGLRRLGWQLVYTDKPTPTFEQNEQEAGGADFSYSIGLTIADDGRVRAVSWGGPAFQAGMAPGVRITAVAGAPYTRAALHDAARKTTMTPVVLTWEQDGRSKTRTIGYHGGLRYPRLQRIAGRADELTSLLTAR
ncbi:hypothetical protein [Sphingomonas morindae]|uniref:PDZ domain-containing protein n=1 Tax=Sphingomonas morindae TaxID=1541170 RepID=A0ABY4X9E7_9SPHN|nr:hypothetical protein [Sphingomonas morindae]USI73552.1 hypothetical protein LHA26_03460 [Sphingomonas morindae]